ncbi:PAS domain S-box protein [Paenibacillus sanfengchensis]|uniref:PAS domain S-box protein n=1 Tax=Paenibacillus sanfengchensis TaxID=3119819 RepID=UPI002FDF87B6
MYSISLEIVVSVGIILLLTLFGLGYSYRNRIRELEFKLEQAEQRARLMEDMLNNIDVGTWSYDNETDSVSFVSRAFLGITGYVPEIFTSKTAWERIVYPEDMHWLSTLAAQVKQGETVVDSHRIVHSDGEVRWIELRMIPTMNEFGQIVRLDGILTDITDNRRIEEELQEVEQRFYRFTELSPHPMVVQKDGRLVYVNPAGLRMIGMKKLDDIVGEEIYCLLPSGEWEKARRRISAIAEEKFGEAVEYQILGPGGRIIQTEVTGVYDAHTGATVHVFYDISERKKMETALKESMERYRRLVELSPVAIALCHAGMIVYVNPAGLRILGATKLSDVVGTTPWDWVCQEDRAWAKSLIQDLVASGSLPPEEMTLVRTDGEELEALVVGIYDAAHSSIEIVFEDITSRKKAERALLASEELNRHLVELSPLSIILHHNYRITYINPAGIALYGAKAPEEMLGLNLLELLEPEDVDEVMCWVSGQLESQENTPLIQHRMIRHDGGILEVESVTTGLPHLGQGTAMTLVWDVTTRKKAEEERQNAERKIRESEDRYFRLQMSLDQFSSDLFGVVKVEELNGRLVREARQVLDSCRVSLMKIDPGGGVIITHGGKEIPDGVLQSIRERGADRLPLCQLFDTLDGHYVKIGEVNGESRILCIGESSALLLIQAKRVWLETLSRYVNVLYDNFRVIEDLRRNVDQLASGQMMPQWLLRFMFHLSENERKRLSQDLHDAALQEQIIWYRRLNQLSGNTDLPARHREQLEEIEQGLLDVVYQIRITCNELRPPLLQEEGLERSLETLFEFTQMRTDYAIQFDYSDLGYVIHDDVIIGLYRIVQEMLSNATKHSRATRVVIKLFSNKDRIYLHYEDNGVGMDVDKTANTFNSMGIYGMKERIRSMEGYIEFDSPAEGGLFIRISIPVR